jgi:alcohol dehydrogenase class IV
VTPVARAFGLDASPLGIGDQIADLIAGLVRSLGVPSTLREVGVTEEQTEALVAATVHELRDRGLAGEEEIRALLRAAA